MIKGDKIICINKTYKYNIGDILTYHKYDCLGHFLLLNGYINYIIRDDFAYSFIKLTLYRELKLNKIL